MKMNQLMALVLIIDALVSTVHNNANMVDHITHIQDFAHLSSLTRKALLRLLLVWWQYA
jgi:hypothetical protein